MQQKSVRINIKMIHFFTVNIQSYILPLNIIMRLKILIARKVLYNSWLVEILSTTVFKYLSYHESKPYQV